MNRKIITTAFGALTLIAGVNCLAALSEAEKGYVNQLVTGGPLSIRSVAQSLYNTGNTNPEVLDVAAEVLLEKYPRAGEDHDAVESLSWVCRALGKSGNSRYKPVLEQVENDKGAHRKLRGHCEKGANSLPDQVSNPYAAGTVNLASLRAGGPPSKSASAPAPSMAQTTAATAATMAASPSTAMNPAPARKLQGYGGYELKPVTLADESANRKNIDKVVAKVDENLRNSVNPILTEWNATSASAGSKEKIVIAPHIVGVKKSSGATRFFAGALSGNSYIVMKVKITEQGSGKLIAEPEFYRRANAMAGAWTFGAHDNAMLQKIASLLANYLTANYSTAVGGETGWEP
jgi:hypothetical protein